MILIGISLLNCNPKNAIVNVEVHNPLTNPLDGPAAGNPDGHDAIPAAAGLADVTKPDHVVGTGIPESCTPEAFINAVAKGGVITFNSGSSPVTITLSKTAKLFNDANPDVVIDGGGAIWVRGGRFKAVNCRFFNNRCIDVGPDVGGGAIRVFSQYQGLPVYLVNCTFGGADGFGNTGANGGAISSIGVSWTIINCLFSYNHAVGNGGNPAQSGTVGGGSGGAIYNDGNTMTLALYGCKIENNYVNAIGSAIFFVTNDHTGNIHIENSVIRNNIGGSWYTLPGISMHSDTKIDVVNSEIK